MYEKKIFFYPVRNKFSNGVYSLILFLILIFNIGLPQAEAQVVIKISAINPLDTETTIPIKSYLPKGVRPENIIDRGNFEVNFDEEKDLYYLEQELTLAPRKIIILEAEIEDIWVIDEKTLVQLKEETSRLTSLALANKKIDSKTILALKDQIFKELDEIKQKQDSNKAVQVGAEEHIEAYEENLKTLEQAEADIEILKTLIRK